MYCGCYDTERKERSRCADVRAKGERRPRCVPASEPVELLHEGKTRRSASGVGRSASQGTRTPRSFIGESAASASLREQAHHAVGSGQRHRDSRALTLARGDAERAAVLAHNVAHDEKSEPVAVLLRRVKGLIHVAHDLVRNPRARVRDADPHIRVIVAREHQNAAVRAGNGLIGIADQIVKHLKEPLRSAGDRGSRTPARQHPAERSPARASPAHF